MTLLVPSYCAWAQTPYAQRPVAAALGIFDGVHMGHRALVTALLRCGQQGTCVTAALTFDPHPAKVLRPTYAPQLLEPIEARVDHMRQLGVDAVIVHPFSMQTAAIPADVFVCDVLVALLHVRHVVVGADFVFGYRQQGTVALLQAMGQTHGFEVHALPAVRVAGIVASSTKIREFVRRGAMPGASELLGRPYRLYGAVVGPPVAQMPHWQPWAAAAECMPAPGLYAAWGNDGRSQQALLVQVVHQGDDDDHTVGVYIFPIQGEDVLCGPLTHLSMVLRLHALPVAASAAPGAPTTSDIAAARAALGQTGTEHTFNQP